jgi:TonB-dependent starch-binding outer membrane protein SusC
MKKIKFFYEWDFHCLMKTFRIMRITVFLILCSILQSIASEAYSQRTRFSLDFSETKLSDVLDEIETRSEFFFLYNEKLVDTDRKVTQTFRNQRVEAILDILFEDTDVVYTITDRKIILAPSYLSEKQQQQNSVSGKVTDDTGQPLPGATVVIKGTMQGTVSDINGNYFLSGVEGNATIVFSFVGMKTQEIAVAGRNTINVALLKDFIGLDEVVAIGFGSMKKRDLTGAISSVNVSEIAQSRPTNNIADALQGKAAGVRITQLNGDANQNSSIQIRGINSITSRQRPLIVINGIPSTSTNLNEVESSDILSLEILKDASAAAIYGAQGAAGVILITTKKGEAGKSTLDFNYTYSVQTPDFDRLPQMVNAQEYIEFFKEAQNNGWVYYQGGNRTDSPAISARKNNANYSYPVEWDDPNVVANWPNTNWLKHYYQPGPAHTANLAASGGNEKGNYRVSTSFTDFTGMLGTTYKRFSVNSAVGANVTSWAKFGTVMNLRLQKEPEQLNWTVELPYQNLPIYMPAGPGQRTGHRITSEFTGVDLTPWQSILFNSNGTSNLEATRLMNINSENLKVYVNPYLEIYPAKGLLFLTNFSYDFSRGNNSSYTPIDNNSQNYPNPNPSFTRGFSKGDHWYYENRINYKKEWGAHRIDFTAGFTAERTDFLGTSMARRYYEDDKIQYLNAGKEITGAGETGAWTHTMASYLGRAFYSYKDKYLATATIRRDGSSRFGSNYKWGSFPSGALVWRISEEDFMKSTKSYIDNLKLRASYGFSGNNSIGNYAWMATINKGFIPLGNSKQATALKGELPKVDLRWEKTGALDIGIDASLFDSHLGFTFDYYNSKTVDLLLNLPISTLTGYSSLLQNIGSVRNRGMEFSVNSLNLNKALKWTTDFNIYFNRSKVLDMGGPPWQDITAANGLPIRAFVGQPLRQYYTLEYIGTYRDQNDIANSPAYTGATPGDAKYVDHNNDGKIDGNDAVVMGNPEPDFSGGITNTFNYKGFELSFLFTYSQGAEKVNLMIRRTYWNQGYRNWSKGYYDNHWSESNPDGYYTKIVPGINVHSMNRIASSVWIEDASFIKLKDVTLAYNIPSKITNGIGVQKARLFFNANNLWIRTNYTGGDPEQGGGNPEVVYDDSYSFFEYSIPRIWTFGINVTF